MFKKAETSVPERQRLESELQTANKDLKSKIKKVGELEESLSKAKN